MVEEVVFKTARGRKITVKCYGSKWKFASVNGKPIMGREYSFGMLEYILDEIKEAQKHEFDRTILLTGGEREGKSTLAAHIATRLGFTDPREVSFSSKAFYDRLWKAEDCSVQWYDEGARGLYSRDWMDRFQRRLSKAFTQIGIKKLVCILCLPHRMLLDYHIRERRISYWGHVVTDKYRRGYVKWRIPKKNEWHVDAYWEPLFVMHFPKFRENNGFNWDEYTKIKRGELDGYFTEDESDKPLKVVPFLRRTLKTLHDQGKTVKELAELSGLAERTVYTHLEKAPK